MDTPVEENVKSKKVLTPNSQKKKKNPWDNMKGSNLRITGLEEGEEGS